MEWVLIFAFAVLVSIGTGPVLAKVQSSTNPQLVRVQSSYAGRTLARATVFFAVIVAAAMLMDFVGEKPSLPSA